MLCPNCCDSAQYFEHARPVEIGELVSCSSHISIETARKMVIAIAEAIPLGEDDPAYSVNSHTWEVDFWLGPIWMCTAELNDSLAGLSHAEVDAELTEIMDNVMAGWLDDEISEAWLQTFKL